MASGKTRNDTLTSLQLAFRAQATGTVLLHSAVAARLGIGITDLSCLNLLTMYGPQTAGQLAVHLGLTRGGAITGMIDRLEAGGYVRRERDPGDRRRVLVMVVADKIVREVVPVFEVLWDAQVEQFAAMTGEQLRWLSEVVTGTVAAMDEARASLRGIPAGPRPGSEPPGGALS